MTAGWVNTPETGEQTEPENNLELKPKAIVKAKPDTAN
jgi:hypothetical protein